MTKQELTNLVIEIVTKANELKNAYTDASDAHVNYACIFTQSDEEFDEMVKLADELGAVIQETPTGPLYKINPIETCAGLLSLLKIRRFDENHRDLGDADFTIKNYHSFKEKYIKHTGFKLIERPTMEMIELMDPDSDVRAYFSFPPLDEQLGLT